MVLLLEDRFQLKIHRETRQLLGCHCIGSGATELIHIGQAVLGLGGGLDYFLTTVFNYPTMAECYKVAALDGINKLSLWAEIEPAADDFISTIGSEAGQRDGHTLDAAFRQLHQHVVGVRFQPGVAAEAALVGLRPE